MTEVLLHKVAKKKLDKYSGSTYESLINAIDRLSNEKYLRDSERIPGTNLFSYRVGNYRLILTGDIKKIVVLDILTKNQLQNELERMWSDF